jgi:regulator of replication initiation timing
MESFKRVKQELQEENTKQEKENAELTQKIESLLNENKSAKSEVRMLRNRMEDLQEQMSRVQTSAGGKEEDRKTQTTEHSQSEVNVCHLCSDQVMNWKG